MARYKITEQMKTGPEHIVYAVPVGTSEADAIVIARQMREDLYGIVRLREAGEVSPDTRAAMDALTGADREATSPAMATLLVRAAAESAGRVVLTIR
jgi:hypothetical protein